MKLSSVLALTTLAASPAFAQEMRQLDSHEHGVGRLDIAIDGSQIAMELHAPGADIVGFEYAAESDEDIVRVENALTALADPFALFVFPDAARCVVVDARAELEGEDAHEGEGHEDHAEEGHGDHDDHDDHEDEGHDDHAEDAGHTEFHAEYLLDCGDITALTEISFAYFTIFPNAIEIEVQVISDSGAMSFEVEREAAMLDLSDVN